MVDSRECVPQEAASWDRMIYGEGQACMKPARGRRQVGDLFCFPDLLLEDL